MGAFEYFQSRGYSFLEPIKSNLCMIFKKAIVYDFSKKLLSLNSLEMNKLTMNGEILNFRPDVTFPSLPRRHFQGSSYFFPPHKRLLNREQHSFPTLSQSRCTVKPRYNEVSRYRKKCSLYRGLRYSEDPVITNYPVNNRNIRYSGVI